MQKLEGFTLEKQLLPWVRLGRLGLSCPEGFPDSTEKMKGKPHTLEILAVRVYDRGRTCTWNT